MENKTAVLLINIGTPDQPSVKSVRRYLFSFLNDRRVIDLPWLLQKILVNLIIVPFRAPKSTKLYKTLWTENGSPLTYYSNLVKNKLAKILPDNFDVYLAMRYENPNLKRILSEIEEKNYDRLIVFPQFPHYASSTTGTANQAVMDIVSKWNVMPEIRLINQFYEHTGYIQSFVKRMKEMKYESYDHIIFSYHGLPLRQVDKTHPGIKSVDCTCNKEMPEHGKYCYKATCYHTSRIMADELSLKQEDYTVSFQSRLSNNWLEPFTDQIIESLARKGKKNILVCAPAFVADCLETIVEIGVEYQELVHEVEGAKVTLVLSLNDMDDWIEAIHNIITTQK